MEPKEMTALLQPPLVNVISNQLQPIVALIDCSRSFFFFFFRKIVEIERSPSLAAISLSRNKKNNWKPSS